MKKYMVSEAGRVEIVEARRLMEAQRVALKMGFTYDAEIAELRNVSPEQAAYEKYAAWKHSLRKGFDRNREECYWGETSDRSSDQPVCPLTDDEKILARKWAKFTGDRTFPA